MEGSDDDRGTESVQENDSSADDLLGDGEYMITTCGDGPRGGLQLLFDNRDNTETTRVGLFNNPVAITSAASSDDEVPPAHAETGRYHMQTATCKQGPGAFALSFLDAISEKVLGAGTAAKMKWQLVAKGAPSERAVGVLYPPHFHKLTCQVFRRSTYGVAAAACKMTTGGLSMAMSRCETNLKGSCTWNKQPRFKNRVFRDVNKSGQAEHVKACICGHPVDPHPPQSYLHPLDACLLYTTTGGLCIDDRAGAGAGVDEP